MHFLVGLRQLCRYLHIVSLTASPAPSKLSMDDQDIDLDELEADPLADESPQSLPTLSQIHNAGPPAVSEPPPRHRSQWVGVRSPHAAPKSADPQPAQKDPANRVSRRKEGKYVAKATSRKDEGRQAHQEEEHTSRGENPLDSADETAPSKQSTTKKRKKPAEEDEQMAMAVSLWAFSLYIVLKQVVQMLVGSKIAYMVTCISIKNQQSKKGKLLKNPKDAKSEVLSLLDDEPFDTFQAQLLALFSQNHKSIKNKNSWRWFDVRWLIPHVHSTSTGLEIEEHYRVMLEKAASCGGKVEVKIQMTERSKESVSCTSYILAP